MAASRSSSTSFSNASTSPCAACKLLRRTCNSDCVFAPYFPDDQSQQFANVEKIFGASNVANMLNDLPIHQKGDAANSLIFEADARVKEPIYGCVGAISRLQLEVAQLQKELCSAHTGIDRYGVYTAGQEYKGSAYGGASASF
ncbi:hypothetical protein O6H91_04G139200 [Diphasiastrum complanatum]|uniref:Uncharacterized protein n=2 Tax=Diphasiastrum complanatum TaxID=34168 RepID=A0ACC2E2C7_DIPCM|nr:hypothetical protein O6H91_04G138500 [Diphasiastrum complanatum]KAJ7560654.1 hypothetical protein O6H91_04G139200 [Diphasiastrum complanatum]